MKGYITTGETKKRLGVSQYTLNKFIAEGRIRTRQFVTGGWIYCLESDVVSLLESIYSEPVDPLQPVSSPLNPFPSQAPQLPPNQAPQLPLNQAPVSSQPVEVEVNLNDTAE